MLELLGVVLSGYLGGLSTTNRIDPKKIRTKPHKVIPKGCKEYTIDGETYVASSKKTAYKKHQKKLNQQKQLQ